MVGAVISGPLYPSHSLLRKALRSHPSRCSCSSFPWLAQSFQAPCTLHIPCCAKLYDHILLDVLVHHFHGWRSHFRPLVPFTFLAAQSFTITSFSMFLFIISMVGAVISGPLYPSHSLLRK